MHFRISGWSAIVLTERPAGESGQRQGESGVVIALYILLHAKEISVVLPR